VATWPALFAQQVSCSPDAVAVVLDDVQLTYRELDERANRLAHLLDAGPDDVVGLMLPRSVSMVVAQVAVLKAGAAYLPLDPDYPPERLAYMLGDARPRAVVTVTELSAALPDGPTPRLVLDTPDTVAQLAAQPTTDPAPPLDVRNAAYVIYTSGSTGRPKGVVLTHAGVAKLIATQTERFGIGPHSRILQFASPSFDVAFWELCLSLLAGGRLVVVPAERRVPGPELAEYAWAHDVTFMILPPVLLAAMPPGVTLPPATLLAGTERVAPSLVERWGRGRRMFNAYGPTEATVNSTLGESHPDRLRGASVPIGVADPMTTTHVLDAKLNPTDEGELYLGGPGLARGYLGRPDLTAERFVADPFGTPGERLYRTGDLVRRDENGVLDFLGRVDEQVKIRGYRIEPGEIESVLLDHDAVAQVTVQAREDKAGQQPRLVAYIVPDAERRDITRSATAPARFRDATAMIGAIREHAQERLPLYMVPAAFVLLDALPVLPSGKLDRAALPAPDFGAQASGHRPRTPREELLCAVFAEVLGVSGVGIDDDFFTVGGDSIVSIQLAIRARAEGLVLSPRQVFEHRTVARLAEVAGAVREARVEDPSAGVGELALMPIMRWLDECGGPVRAFSQALLVSAPAGMTHDQLRAVLDAVVARHDVLRSRIVRARGDSPGALHVDATGSADGWIHRHDITGRAEHEVTALVETETERVSALLDPEAGVMVQVVWFDAGPDRPGRLLLVIHHWVVDGVSWRILLPDLAAAWEAVVAGATPSLPTGGTSLRRWSELVHGEADRRVAELPIWTAALDGPDPALTDRPLDPVADRASVEHLTLWLDDAEPLLTSVPAAFHGGVNDVLLTALALAVRRWRGDEGPDEGSVLVALEGHGREEQIAPDVDLSRTLGWFTSIFPVRLDPGDVDEREAFAGGPAIGRALKRVKEQLRAIPDHGIGYGLLRHLHAEAGPRLAALPQPQISFNYLGRFSIGDPTRPWTAFSGAGVLAGGYDTAMPVAPYVLEINAFTEDGEAGSRLGVTWAYPSALLKAGDVRELAEGWFAALTALVTHVHGNAGGGHTPSDLGLVSLTQDEIDEFEAEWESL
jgi:amino acid adenylation domain-containing protein/non-ribosomal peptide synthase protein (TIGR01720 family)